MRFVDNNIDIFRFIVELNYKVQIHVEHIIYKKNTVDKSDKYMFVFEKLSAFKKSHTWYVLKYKDLHNKIKAIEILEKYQF